MSTDVNYLELRDLPSQDTSDDVDGSFVDRADLAKDNEGNKLDRRDSNKSENARVDKSAKKNSKEVTKTLASDLSNKSTTAVVDNKVNDSALSEADRLELQHMQQRINELNLKKKNGKNVEGLAQVELPALSAQHLDELEQDAFAILAIEEQQNSTPTSAADDGHKKSVVAGDVVDMDSNAEDGVVNVLNEEGIDIAEEDIDEDVSGAEVETFADEQQPRQQKKKQQDGEGAKTSKLKDSTSTTDADTVTVASNATVSSSRPPLVVADVNEQADEHETIELEAEEQEELALIEREMLEAMQPMQRDKFQRVNAALRSVQQMIAQTQQVQHN